MRCHFTFLLGVCKKMKINPLKLSPNRSLIAMALAVTLVLSVLGQSEHPSISEGHRSAYFKDGEIHVNVLGEPDPKRVKNIIIWERVVF